MEHQLKRFPKVSVITPSFNQGQYLRETLQSIVDQRYPELELIVIDGGSSDGSVTVIESFADHVAYWVSEKDEGQSHAINKGFSKATGEILCWLNSDDLFLPGALNTVAYHFSMNEQCNWLTAPTLKFGKGLDHPAMRYDIPDSRLDWLVRCPISQPSTFWKRSLYEQHGRIDEQFHYALDYEYWVRFVFGGEHVHFVNRPLSAFRLHDVSKTVSQVEEFKKEEVLLRETYRSQLTASEWSKMSRKVGRQDDLDAIAAGVRLIGEGRAHEAKKSVTRVLKSKPGLLFTRIGAASLYRVLMKKPRDS